MEKVYDLQKTIPSQQYVFFGCLFFVLAIQSPTATEYGFPTCPWENTWISKLRHD